MTNSDVSWVNSNHDVTVNRPSVTNTQSSSSIRRIMALRSYQPVPLLLAIAACGSAAQRSSPELATASAPVTAEGCHEDVGKLPVEIRWLQAPTPTSEATLDPRVVELAVTNALAETVQVNLLVRSTAQPRQRQSTFGPLTLAAGGRHVVTLLLDQQVDDLRALTVSGRLDALASVTVRGAARAIDVGSPPVYFHQDPTGAAVLYGEDVLRRKYRAGDLAGVVDPRVADLATAIEVVDVSALRDAGGVQ